MMSFVKEFLTFLRRRRNYWLLPGLILLCIFGILVVVTEGSAIAPFLYAIF